MHLSYTYVFILRQVLVCTYRLQYSAGEWPKRLIVMQKSTVELTLVAIQPLPSGQTVALPRLLTGAVMAAWERCALVAQRTLPPIRAPAQHIAISK